MTPKTKYLLHSLGILLIAIILSKLWLDTDTPMIVWPDSAGYLSYSSALIRGDWPLIFSDALAYRTPGYPLIISATELALGGTPETMRLSHAFLGLFAFIVVACNLRKIINPILTGIILSLTFLLLEAFFISVISEWSVACVLLMLISLAISSEKDGPVSSTLFFAFGSMFLVFLRPPLIPILVILASLIWQQRRSNPLPRTIISLLVLSPLIFWAANNKVRHGSFSLTPRSGFHLLTLASVIGDIAPQDMQLDVDTDQFLKEFQRRRYPRLDPVTNEYRPTLIEAVYNRNMWEVADAIRLENGWSIEKLNQVSSSLAVDFVRNHPFQYISFIGIEFIKQFEVIGWQYWGLVILVFALYCFGRRTNKQTFVFRWALGFLLLHFLHMALCVSLVHMLYRFASVTFFPFLFVVGVLACLELEDLLQDVSILWKRK